MEYRAEAAAAATATAAATALMVNAQLIVDFLHDRVNDGPERSSHDAKFCCLAGVSVPP